MYFLQIVTFCAVVAVSSAGLLPAAVHYSPAEAVSSQSIVRHDEPQILASKVLAAPVAKYAVTAPVTYHAAPAQVAYHTAPAAYAYQAAPAPIAYQAAPAAKLVAHEEIVSFT